MSCAPVLLKKRQKKRQKRQKKRQKKRLKREMNPGLPSSERMHLPTRVCHVCGNMWVTGGIHSEHILVIGVTRQCPAEGFDQKRSAPHSGPYSGKFLPRTGGGLGMNNKHPKGTKNEEWASQNR